jgi:superfamily II DNA or RNA helicase
MNQDELQADVIKKSLEFYKDYRKGWLDLAMRAGKTRISIEIIRNMFPHSCKLLIAYPDNKLKDTWKEEMIKWKYDNIDITYTNFSSLKKHVSGWWQFFICDEFHSLSENEASLVDQISAGYTLFLSGTISKETKQKWPKFREIYRYTTSQGIDNSILANYTITVHLVDLDNTIKTPNKKGKMLSEKQKYDNYTYVIQQMKYNGQNSMHLALARNRLSLSSIGKVEYTKKLLNKLNDKRVLVFTGLADVADSLDIYSYHSKSTEDGHFKAFLASKLNHLALAEMGKMGVTYPMLDSVILLNFTYNAEMSSQLLNRAINLDYKGKIADLHVICLNESPELKKVKESLSMLDSSKIKYI